MYIAIPSWSPLLLIPVFFIICLLLIKKQNKKIMALETLVKSMLSANIDLKKEIAQIQSSSITIRKKIQQLNESTESIQTKQINLAAQTPENRLYSRATKMLELGASLDEVMRECELPKAEAELLMNLRAKISS